MCFIKKNLGMVILFISLPSLANSKNIFETKCGNISVNNIFSHYKIYDPKMYRGSLQTVQEAKKWAGDSAFIGRKYFKIKNEEIKNPVYKIKCYKPFIEGEVPLPSQRLSNFYGIGMDRERIDILYIYDPQSKKEVTKFDIVGKELWWLPTGWFYKLKPVISNTSLCQSNEVAQFSCQLDNQKNVSICQASGSGQLHYRYGTQEKIELTYPNSHESAIAWHPSNSVLASFHRGKYHYQITHQDDANHAPFALSVTKGNQLLFSKQCTHVF